MYNKIVFKYCTLNKIPDELYYLTDELVGYSRIDNYPIYSIKFESNIGVLKYLYSDDFNGDIFEEVKKYLRKFKIDKLMTESKGKKYINKDLEKFSTFLQYYYTSKGTINIIELIKQ